MDFLKSLLNSMMSKNERHLAATLDVILTPASPYNIDTTCVTTFVIPRDKGDSSSLGEEVCKKFMEHCFKERFDKVRPEWLKNPDTGCCLELDCFNERLKIAVEYNGRQHYKWPSLPGLTEEEFEKIVKRDKYKRRCCNAYGVKLIIVPYTVDHELIPMYIIRQLR